MKFSRCLILLFGSLMSFSEALEQACRLNCQHGRCEFVSDEHEDLALLVQSGKMIEKCVCDEGFGGMGCDVEEHACQSNGKCINGLPCIQSKSTGEFSCDCSVAEHVSKFAGMMCQHPYTEYCGDRYDPNDSTSFCTNGGKCKSSIIGAQVAPGNTTVNNEYRHLGCICPKDFYGPHCEFLQFDRLPMVDNRNGEDLSHGSPNHGDIQRAPATSGWKSHLTDVKLLAIVGAGCLLFLLFAYTLLSFRRRRRRARLECMAKHTDDPITPIDVDDASRGSEAIGHLLLRPHNRLESSSQAPSLKVTRCSDFGDKVVRHEAGEGLYREEDFSFDPSLDGLSLDSSPVDVEGHRNTLSRRGQASVGEQSLSLPSIAESTSTGQGSRGIQKVQSREKQGYFL